MNWILPLHQIEDQDKESVGGKAFSLAKMVQRGINIPEAVCIQAAAYFHYVMETGLRDRILLELNRKDFQDMRWEEIWDTSLRIRNMFHNTPIPPDLSRSLKIEIEEKFKDQPVVVRSSAPGEDSSQTSFAGLHESYVNIREAETILEHIRLVWASLWSDRALLYRQELGLDVGKSTMAVLVQRLIIGERSGIVFGVNPNDKSQAVIEAVYGLNQGLVDGTIEPDRWILDRKTGQILSHHAPSREKWITPSEEGIHIDSLPLDKSNRSPLTEQKIDKVFHLCLRSEEYFGAPQDMEWTFQGEDLYLLQSRPITTLSSQSPEDKRPWYLSLRRSFENLKTLRKKIEEEWIPAMICEADHLALEDMFSLSDSQLADEIEKRRDVHNRWLEIYWREFIPFAHGMRLFGQVYNDFFHPSDPYEFMDLLANRELKSLERNRRLQRMASWIRKDSLLAKNLREGRMNKNEKFVKEFDQFIKEFGDLSCYNQKLAACDLDIEAIVRLLLEMAKQPPKKRKEGKNTETMRENFISRFKDEQKGFATELLDLGRASYQLRDDDNIYLGRIERQMVTAVNEGKRRIEKRIGHRIDSIEISELMGALKNPDHLPKEKTVDDKTTTPPMSQEWIKVRQIVGQPASPGIAKGKAHVILNPSDLFDFKSGEILVCDAIDPNMTFVIPIAAGIVERRGGMLIHGAIIAREYGLPCVTGVPNATSLIKTGDPVTVDGFLGIVILG